MTIKISTRSLVRIGLVALWIMFPSIVAAQSTLRIAGKDVQIHGSIQQGFGFTNQNNLLTMETTDGSVALTDGAINVMSSLTPKLRAGAQLYVRNIGDLGNGQLQVDWAFADYRFAPAFGIRGGKIKTVLGLFTDTQDMEFLYTWALLPQGTYPLDLRSVTIAHVGGDVYGTVNLGKAGALDYTGYGGIIQDDEHGGYRYGLEDLGFTVPSGIDTKAGGFDARWTTPVSGLMAGYSLMQARTTAPVFVAMYQMNLLSTTSPWRRQALYADFQGNRLRVSGEWRHELRDTVLTPAIYPEDIAKSESAFLAASYRLSRWVEVGSYYSRFVFDTDLPSSNPDNHIFDTVVSGRIDVNRFWHVKVEGHFMDGNGSQWLARGFYLRDNPLGFHAKTNMLVLRTGVNF